MSLIALASQDGWFVGGTPLKYALIHYDSVSGNRVRNVAVHRVDLSVADPSAVVELTVGRFEIPGAFDGSGEYPRYFRGNDPTEITWASQYRSFDISETGVLPQVHGRYYVSGPSPLTLQFKEPLEALVDGPSSDGFAFMIKRVDDTEAVDFHLNTWFEVY